MYSRIGLLLSRDEGAIRLLSIQSRFCADPNSISSTILLSPSTALTYRWGNQYGGAQRVVNYEEAVSPEMPFVAEAFVPGIVPYLCLNFRRWADPCCGFCANFECNGLGQKGLRDKGK
jgi:hypothetical protein